MIKITVAALALLSVSALSASAREADVSVRCEAKGKSLSNKGERPMNVDAELKFVVARNAEGLRMLRSIEGRIVTSPEDPEASYIGNFAIAEGPTENPKYRPSKYVGHSQFLHLDATDTTGSSEDGMWGNFVLAQDRSKPKFSAHYIFQAGDHMGGTVHFTCTLTK